MAKLVINSVPKNNANSSILKGLFLAESGYCTDLSALQGPMATGHQMRLCYFVSGKGAVDISGKSHLVQQHDILFLTGQRKANLIANQEIPMEIWWLDCNGPAVPELLRQLSVSAAHPLIHGIYEPRLFQEIKSIVMHYDALSAADELHVASGLYKIFALLLDSCSSSQWVSVPHDSPDLLYTGNWLPWPSGEVHAEYYTSAPKSYAEFSFFGSGIKWFGTANFDCGLADVIIDGNYVTTVDSYNRERLSKQLLYSNSRLNYGHHIIKIFCTGARNDKSTNCDVVVESFQYLTAAVPHEVEDAGGTNSQLIRKAVSLMHSGISAITVDQLAAELNVNRSYLSSRFSSEVGMSPSQYLTRVRMSTAKQLLRETDLSIGQVAARVGYNDIFYFSRLFKTREKITPTQYRQLNK